MCTYRGNSADLSDVLFVTLRTRRTTRSSSAVPEGVVILERVFTCTWTHCLQTDRQVSDRQVREDMQTDRLSHLPSVVVVVVVGPVTVVIVTV